MKKRIILLIAIFALLICVFAISVSAESEIPEFTDIIDISSKIDTTSIEDALQGDNSSRVLLKDADGYATYLSKYITIFPGNKSMCRFSVDFQALNEATGKEYDMTSIVCIEVPEGVLGLNDYANIKSWTSLVYIKLPTSLNFTVKEFYKQHPSLKVVDYSQSSVTSFDTSLFAECKALEVVRFPKGLESMGNVALHNIPTLERVYFPDTFTKTGSLIDGKTQNFAIFYTGGTDDDSVRTLFRSMMPTSFAPKIVVEEWDPTKSDDYYFAKAQALDLTDDGYVPAGQNKYSNNAVLVVYKYNECKAFYYDAHDYKGTGNCLDGVECTRCQNKIESFEKHNMVESLVYDSLLMEGVYNKYCANASDCVVDRIKDGVAPAIFGSEGFSTKGEDGISSGYTVNVDALDEYNRINGKLTVGIMVVNPNYLDGRDSFLDADGKVNTSAGALQVNMTENKYSNISIAITGFTGDAQKVSLVIALYAYTDAGEVEFVQSQTTRCASENVTIGEDSLYTVTLASVKSANSDLSDLGDYVMPSQKEQE